MSWIGGTLVCDASKEGLALAAEEITRQVRDNGNVGEFPGLGMYNPLCCFTHREFDSEQEAEEYLYASENYKKWARSKDPYVVFWKARQKDLLEIEKAKKELENAVEESSETAEATLPINRKSDFISCKRGCGSKLNRRVLGSRYKCPVCGKTLRSKTDQKKG